jgi:hypothetical protein
MWVPTVRTQKHMAPTYLLDPLKHARTFANSVTTNLLYENRIHARLNRYQRGRRQRKACGAAPHAWSLSSNVDKFTYLFNVSDVLVAHPSHALTAAGSAGAAGSTGGARRIVIPSPKSRLQAQARLRRLPHPRHHSAGVIW